MKPSGLIIYIYIGGADESFLENIKEVCSLIKKGNYRYKRNHGHGLALEEGTSISFSSQTKSPSSEWESRDCQGTLKVSWEECNFIRGVYKE